jgi:hypothetical protein
MRLLYDALALICVVGGYLLLVLRFQEVYVGLFRALHGDSEGSSAARPGSSAPPES